MGFNIAAFGAFDVNSLGDMLFPKALTVELGKRLTISRIIFFSPTNAESEYNLGYEIYPYEEFEKLHGECSFDAIIIGGGELLHYREIKFTGSQEEIISYKNGRIWRYPVEMGQKYNIKVLINSVGMPHDISKSDKELLNNLDYVSFRDKYSLCRFYGSETIANGNVVPDSLWNLDEYFPIISDKNAVKYASKITGLPEEPYAVLQLGTLDNCIRIFECVHTYCQEKGLRIVVVAVNWCHDDKKVISEIKREGYSNCCIMDRILRVDEIMTVISGAHMLVCTSLHGALIGCLSGVKTVICNMYSHFVSKIDGFAEWLGKHDLVVDNMEQLMAALENSSVEVEKIPITEIKRVLNSHFDKMGRIISDSERFTEKVNLQIAEHPLNFDRSFFQWQDANKRLAWRTVISVSSDEHYKIDEWIRHNGDLMWAFKTMDFSVIHVSSPELISEDVDERGRCFDRSVQYTVKSDKEHITFFYTKNVKEQTEEFNELLHRYWNKTAHVELLEKMERRYINEINKRDAEIKKNKDFEQRLLNTEETLSNIIQNYNSESEKMIAALYRDKGILLKENNALKEINTIELETNARIRQELEQLETEVIQLKDTEKQYQAIMKRMQQEILGAEQKAKEDTQEEIVDLQQTIRNKEGHIELLLETEREYEREKKSRTYRLALVFRKISVFILPANSKRRFLMRMLAKGVRHPKLMLHMINPRRIRNFFKIAREEGMSSINNHYKLVEEYEKSMLYPFRTDQLEISEVENAADKTIKDYAHLSFAVYDQPEVSIVIPVYNQFEYTYNCLEAILRNSGDVRYEVVIADDCSTDLTKNLEKVAEGIKVIHNEENLRFLLNCNNAARYAKGEYILFLNNDTQVQAGWLEALISVMKKEPEVGMTGSKLLYSDGYLQEAGGILWKDASAWNYGNRQNPNDSEFNYVHETDYISGAAIMIRAALWTEIGGFDERFVPAYCEDSDLAFEVRKHGYKVVYQPKSTVVHFEGISNGTDVTAGQKKYQVENQKKFYEKWKNELEQSHFPNGTNVFLARDRSRGQKHVLVIDHYVPQYDKDAGSKTTFMYLKMLVQKGYKITFLGDNFYQHEPYTSELQQMGILVLYGPKYAEHWKEWLEENISCFDIFYLNRPHISIKYIDFIKERARGKIIYYGHDLHFLRLRREYELRKDPELLADSDKWREQELYIMGKADMNYYPSEVEIEEIHKIDSSIPAKAINAYVYDTFPALHYKAENRTGFLFVGGFGHGPNLDAVLWFVNSIYPEVYRKTGAPFYIVGSNAPEAITNLAGKNGVIVKGFVTEEELGALYASCRIAVIPLRYGAGVKGKVVEALYYGMPIVTTSVGAEGIEGIEGVAIVRDTEGELAEELIKEYIDGSGLEERSKQCRRFVEERFNVEAAWKVVGQDFQGE